MSTYNVEREMFRVQDRSSSIYVEWLPANINAYFCDVPLKGQEVSGLMMTNSTSIMEVFQRIQGEFSRMFKRKAFMHMLVSEGLH